MKPNYSTIIYLSLFHLFSIIGFFVLFKYNIFVFLEEEFILYNKYIKLIIHFDVYNFFY